MKSNVYKALISSDWNKCLAPCSPFDVITFTYPHLTSTIESVFKKYTGNEITLGEAVTIIESLLPAPVSIAQMDGYLDSSFETYKGVVELIEWCLKKDYLFMINTTGPIGYFQRVFAKGLLPRIPILAANPMIRFQSLESTPCIYDLKEISDKADITEKVLKNHKIPTKKTIVLGDSGGDGPHLNWAKRHSIYTIGSMTKPSLLKYCADRDIEIDLHFGPVFSDGEKRDHKKEMAVDFLDLRSIFMEILG